MPPVNVRPADVSAPVVREVELVIPEIIEPTMPAIADSGPMNLSDLSFGADTRESQDASGFLESLDVVTPANDTASANVFAGVEEPKSSGGYFWLIVGLVAGAVAAGAYFLIRSGKLHF